MHWTEMDPEEEDWDYEEDWIDCPRCGYEFDANDNLNCPNCGL